MPRGDKPTPTALALKDGWIYEDALPASITKEEYDWWFKESLVLDGVRMGPSLTTKPLSTETLEPMIESGGESLSIYDIMQRFRNDGSCKHIIEQALNNLACLSPASTAPVVDEPDEDVLQELQSTVNAIAYEFMKLFGATAKDGWTHDEMQPVFDATREIITRTFPVLAELSAPAAVTAAPQTNDCPKCGGSGEIEIGCAMDHALTASCVECGGSGHATAAPVEQSGITCMEDVRRLELRQQRESDPASSTSARAAAEEIAKYLEAFTPLSVGGALVGAFESIIERHRR